MRVCETSFSHAKNPAHNSPLPRLARAHLPVCSAALRQLPPDGQRLAGSQMRTRLNGPRDALLIAQVRSCAAAQGLFAHTATCYRLVAGSMLYCSRRLAVSRSARSARVAVLVSTDLRCTHAICAPSHAHAFCLLSPPPAIASWQGHCFLRTLQPAESACGKLTRLCRSGARPARPARPARNSADDLDPRVRLSVVPSLSPFRDFASLPSYFIAPLALVCWATVTGVSSWNVSTCQCVQRVQRVNVSTCQCSCGAFVHAGDGGQDAHSALLPLLPAGGAKPGRGDRRQRQTSPRTAGPDGCVAPPLPRLGTHIWFPCAASHSCV